MPATPACRQDPVRLRVAYRYGISFAQATGHTPSCTRQPIPPKIGLEDSSLRIAPTGVGQTAAVNTAKRVAQPDLFSPPVRGTIPA